MTKHVDDDISEKMMSLVQTSGIVGVFGDTTKICIKTWNADAIEGCL